MKKLFMMFLLVLGAGKLYAQTIVVTETSARKPITLAFDKRPIVDINSKLTVHIDSVRLIANIPQSAKADSQSTADLKSLLIILQTEKELLAALKPAVKGQAVNESAYRELSTLMLRFLSSVEKDPLYSGITNGLYAKASALSKKHQLPTGTLDGYVIQQLSLKATDLAQSIERMANLGSFKIVLQAYINTRTDHERRVHIENFDNYANGQYYEVPRWSTSFSQDDLAKASQTANVLNSLANTKMSELTDVLSKKFPSYECFKSLQDDLNKESGKISATAPATVKAAVNTAIDSVKALNDLIGSIPSLKIKSIDDLTTFGETCQKIIALADTGNIPKLFAALKNIPQNVLQAYPELKDIQAKFTGCNNQLRADVNSIKDYYDIAAAILKPSLQNAQTVKQVVGDSYAFSISNLPTEGYIDLKTTGPRQNGDELVIKVVYRTKEEEEYNVKNVGLGLPAQGTVLENKTIKLQQINFYSETNIGVVFVHPYHNSADVKLDKKFQFAPSGSLILKFGSRKSQFWNDLSPGIGFNVTTPDFDIDGSPDVAYGGVITLFRNVLSAGLSYNTKTGSPFWFFGLSLPFATLGLPVGNVQTQK